MAAKDVAWTARVRYTYLQTCKQYGVSPSVSFLNQFRECIEKKRPLQRISITHGSYGDGQIAPVIATLKLASSISDIALNYIELSDKGCCELLSFLSKHQGVTSLELFGNRIGNVSCSFVPALLNLQTLTRLKLGDNTITAAGARSIAEGLRHQQSLIQLHLGGNNIGDEGLIAIVNALWSNATLTSLGIRDNGIGPIGVQALVQLLRQNDCVLSEVQLKGNAIGDEGAEYLAHAMAKNKTMRVLEVQANGVGPRGAAVLCNALHNNTTVHAINFNDNSLCDEGAEAVAALLMNNTCITTVGMSGNSIEKRGTNAIAKALSCNNSLTGIDLGNNRLGNSGVITLANVLRDQNTTLMSLDVHLNNMNLQGVFALTQALLVNTSLRHLDCGSNYSRNQGAHAWAKVIRKSTTLTRLCLTDNEIGREGGDSLLQAMKFNTTLRNFQFGGQSQAHPLANRITPATRRAINSIVARNKRLWEESQGHGSPLPGRGPSRQPSLDPCCRWASHEPWPATPAGGEGDLGKPGDGAFNRTITEDWNGWDHGGLGGGATEPMQALPTGRRHWDEVTGQPSQSVFHGGLAAAIQGPPSSCSSSAAAAAKAPGGGSRLQHYILGMQAPAAQNTLAFHRGASDELLGDATGEVFCFRGAVDLEAGPPSAPFPWPAAAPRTPVPRSLSPNFPEARPEGTKSAASSPYSTYHSSVGSAEEGEDGLIRRRSIVDSYGPAMSDWRPPSLDIVGRTSPQQPPLPCDPIASNLNPCPMDSPRHVNRGPPLLYGPRSTAFGGLPPACTPPTMDDSTLRTVMAALASLGLDGSKEAGGPPYPAATPGNSSPPPLPAINLALHV